MFKRLDRMVDNANWFNTSSEGNVFVKPRGLMDHNPLDFEEPMQLERFGKPFQFFNFIIDIPGFLDTAAKGWALPCHGSPVAQFSAKLKHTKQLLKNLNKAHVNVHSAVQTARTNLLGFVGNYSLHR